MTVNEPTSKDPVKKKCLVCEKEFAVTKSGVMRHHLGSDYHSDGIFRKLCEGAGKLPLSESGD